MWIGQTYLNLHQPWEAIAPFERALRLREACPGNVGLAEVQFALAFALKQAGRDQKRARSLALQARDGYAMDPEKNSKAVAEINAWLAGKR